MYIYIYAKSMRISVRVSFNLGLLQGFFRVSFGVSLGFLEVFFRFLQGFM